MISYFIFLTVIYAILLFANFTRKQGYKNLNIRREVDRLGINEGEEFNISIIIENNKRLPISFLLLKEIIPRGLQFFGADIYNFDTEYNYHTSRYSILWFQRIKRTYKYKALKRGTYLLKEIYVDLGDIFGFYTDERRIDDYMELLVYPRLIDIKQLKLNNNSLYGDSIIKRWIYKDPLYIRGVREYNKEDRMSDIHWKSTLKMRKLMVKEYEYTSEFELVLILDVQCSEPYWRDVSIETVDLGVRIVASIAKQALKEGVPVGFWTDAKILSYKDGSKNQVEASLKSFKNIMELCARIDYSPNLPFNEYLMQKAKDFKTNCTYVMVTSYLNEKSLGAITLLQRAGYLIKLIDISREDNLPTISNIEKLTFKEEMGR